MYIKTSLKQWSKQAQNFLYFLARRAKNDMIFRVSASLSYTTLIAMVPLFAIGLSIFSAFPAFESIRGQIQEFLLHNMAPALGQEVSGYLSEFLKASAGLTAIGVVSIVVTSILMLSTIENSLNFIFRVSRPRRITTKITLYWTVITLGPLLLGAAFSIRSYFFALTEDDKIFNNIYMSNLLPALITMLMLMIVYIFVPNKKIRIRNAAGGALVALIIFWALRKIFGIVVLNSATYQTLYGALAVIPLFLIWMYLAWSVVIFGAVITAALEDYQQLDEHSLKRIMVSDAPEKRDFNKINNPQKKLLQKEHK